MSYQTYLKLGGRPEDLCKLRAGLTTAGGDPLPSKGYTQPIQFMLGDVECLHSFIIVNCLATDDVILGRDFLIKYDVLVDVPRRRIEIRNPNLDYSIKAIPTQDQQKRKYLATLEESLHIKGGTQVNAPCRVAPRRGRDPVGAVRGTWLAMVEPTRDRQKMTELGINNAAAVILVKQNETLIPLVSAKHNEADYEMQTTKILPKYAKVELQPITYKYERLTPQGIDHRFVHPRALRYQRPPKFRFGYSPLGNGN